MEYPGKGIQILGNKINDNLHVVAGHATLNNIISNTGSRTTQNYPRWARRHRLLENTHVDEPPSRTSSAPRPDPPRKHQLHPWDGEWPRTTCTHGDGLLVWDPSSGLCLYWSWKLLSFPALSVLLTNISVFQSLSRRVTPMHTNEAKDLLLLWE